MSNKRFRSATVLPTITLSDTYTTGTLSLEYQVLALGVRLGL